MNPSDENLDALLREGLRRPDLSCEGFERRVLAALPRRRRVLPPYPILIWLGALSAAAALGYGIILGAPPLDAAAEWAQGASAPWSRAAFSIAAVSCVYAGWAARAAFGLRRPARR